MTFLPAGPWCYSLFMVLGFDLSFVGLSFSTRSIYFNKRMCFYNPRLYVYMKFPIAQWSYEATSARGSPNLRTSHRCNRTLVLP